MIVTNSPTKNSIQGAQFGINRRRRLSGRKTAGLISDQVVTTDGRQQSLGEKADDGLQFTEFYFERRWFFLERQNTLLLTLRPQNDSIFNPEAGPVRLDEHNTCYRINALTQRLGQREARAKT